MKRLRRNHEGSIKVHDEKRDIWHRPIRFYHCGEYGEKFRRPHYHACLFNFDFDDKKLWKRENDCDYFVSKQLENLWINENGDTMGHCLIGDVTFESAAYVARYIMKKINGDAAEEHYVNRETGEVLTPEYTTMSRRPGIGTGWFKKFKDDVYPGDFVVMRGKQMRPPKFYDRQFELTNPSDFRRIKSNRIVNAKEFADDNTPERLKVREKVAEARLKNLPRKLESEI